MCEIRDTYYFNRIIIKEEKKYYLYKIECIIDKLMWVLCKSESVK